MYIMTYTTAYLSKKGVYNKYVKDSTDRVGVLDTDDLVKDVFTVDELENLLTKLPSIRIKGIKHNGKNIESLLCYSNNNHFLIYNDVCLHYEQKIDRGSYCTLRLFIKGTTCEKGCDLQVDTPHVEGCWDWNFKVEGSKPTEYGYDVLVSCYLRSKNRIRETTGLVFSIDIRNKVYDIKKVIEVD